MIDCSILRDRMPEVARGSDRWTEAEAAHLGGCTECGPEWRLVQAGRRLQEGMTVDGDRIAATVVARLRVAPPVPTGIRRLPWRGGLIGLLAAAASVALILSAPRMLRTDDGTAATDSIVVSVLPELQALSDSDLQVVLRESGPTVSDAAPGVIPHLEDLTDAELQQLLDATEGE